MFTWPDNIRTFFPYFKGESPEDQLQNQKSSSSTTKVNAAVNKLNLALLLFFSKLNIIRVTLLSKTVAEKVLK